MCLARPEGSNYYGAPVQQPRVEQQQIFEHHKSSFRDPSSFSQDFNRYDNGPVSVSVHPSMSYSLPVQNIGYEQSYNRDYQAPSVQSFSSNRDVQQTYSAPSEIRGQGFVTETNNYSPSRYNLNNDDSFGSQNRGRLTQSNRVFSSDTNTNFNNNQNIHGGSHQGSHGSFIQPKTIITKDVYVHAAPEEPEEFVRQDIQPQVNHKHYKIVFIKVPQASVQQQIQVQQQAQNEEKTIVYVLVKKPELNTEIINQQTPVHPVSKPEVYFIRYKTHKGREQYKYNTAPKSVITSNKSHSQSDSVPSSVSSGHVSNNHDDRQLGDTYSSALSGIEHDGGTYPEETRTRKSNVSTYGPANYRPPAPIG